jgi:hypothetical protein
MEAPTRLCDRANTLCFAYAIWTLPVFAVANVNSKRWLARGGVYSYYEFRHPMSERMTDAGWRSLPVRPSLPNWTSSFMAR